MKDKITCFKLNWYDCGLCCVEDTVQEEIIEVCDCIRKGKTESDVHPLSSSIKILEQMDEIRKQFRRTSRISYRRLQPRSNEYQRACRPIHGAACKRG